MQTQVLESARPEFERRGERLVARARKSIYFGTAPERLDLVLTRTEGDTLRAWRASVPLTLAGPDPAPRMGSPTPRGSSRRYRAPRPGE